MDDLGEEEEDSSEARLLQTIGILNKTAIAESLDHFLTFRLWSKAIIGLPLQLMKGCFGDFLRFSQWLIGEKFSHPNIDPPLWHSRVLGFFTDYIWMALALFDHLHPMLTFDTCGRVVMDADVELGREWDRFLDAGLLSVWALHSPHEIIEKGIPILIDLWKKKGVKESETGGEKEKERDDREKESEDDKEEEGEKITEERERKEKEAASHQEERSSSAPPMTRLFEDLNFDGFDFVYDPKFAEIADFIERHQPDGIKTLRMHTCSRISAPTLSRFLSPSLTVLELIDTPFPNSLFAIMCSQCVRLQRLVLDVRQSSYAPDNWLEMIMENMKDLRELETDQEIHPKATHNKETLLAPLEVLRFSDQRGVLAAGYSMPNLWSLHVFGDYIDKTAPNIGRFVALRRLAFRSTNFERREVVDHMEKMCSELARGCPFLEELDLTPLPVTPHHLETLASTGKITNLLKLSINMVKNFTTHEEGPEYETTFMRTVAQKFPSLKHLSIDCSGVFERQGEVLLGLCGGGNIEAGTPPLRLESLFVGSNYDGIREWLKVLRFFRGSLKKISPLPRDTTDEHVEELCEVLHYVEYLNLSITGLSVEGVKKLVSSMWCLKSIELPTRLSEDSNLDWLELVMAEMSLTVEKVIAQESWTTGEHGLCVPVTSWPRLLELRKGGKPVILEIRSHANSFAKVKLTAALGPEDDTIDKRDSLSVIVASGDPVHSQLLLLQKLHRCTV